MSAEDTIRRLEDQLKKLEGDLRVSQLQNQGGDGSNVVVTSTKDRKIEKFTPSIDVDEWTLNVESHVTKKYVTEQERVIFIWDRLHEDVKTELRLQVDHHKSTTNELLTLMKNIYGVKKSSFELELDFYARNQTPDETLVSYSHELMNILFLLQKQSANIKTDQMLKQKFADGVADHELRRELKRLNRENKDIKFYELRDLATDWTKDVKPDVTKFDSLVEKINLQQQQIETLTATVTEQSHKMDEDSPASNNQSQWTGNGFRGRGRGNGRGWNKSRNWKVDHGPKRSDDSADRDLKHDDPVICHYCSQPNHIAPNCFKKRRDLKRGALKKASSN